MQITIVAERGEGLNMGAVEKKEIKWRCREKIKEEERKREKLHQKWVKSLDLYSKLLHKLG